MAQEPENVNFSYHERERTTPVAKTLHERMMLEAEPLIQYNWTDVAIHDKRKLSIVPPCHVCAWIVGSTGSYLSPMYCELADAHKWKANVFAHEAAITILMARWHDQLNCLYDLAFNPLEEKAFYLVKKGEAGAGEIIPVDKVELAELCTYSKFNWTSHGFLPSLNGK